VGVVNGAGWFADVSPDEIGDYHWQPCFETGLGHIPCFDIWFKTRAECETWIRENVLAHNVMLDDWTCPDCRATVSRYVEGEGEMAEWEIAFLHECEGDG